MAEDPMHTFGDRMRLAREQRGWSQLELARRAEVDQSWISKLESGARQGIYLSAARRIALALGVTLDYLAAMPERTEPDGSGRRSAAERVGLVGSTALLVDTTCVKGHACAKYTTS